MKRTGLLIAAALLLPSAALAAPGLVTDTVSLRAGPGDGFPAVDRIPAGSHVDIHGCLKGDAWCDVSWSDDRGWVSSDELQWLYRNHYVYLSDYYDEIDVPVVSFVVGSYWSSYYASRPFFRQRAHFDHYWRTHQSIAMRTPDRIAHARSTSGVAVRDHNRGPDARTTIDSRSQANIRNRDRGADARAAVEMRNRADLRGRGRMEMRGPERARIRNDEHGRMAGTNRNFGPAMTHAAPSARFSTGAPAQARAQFAQPNVSHSSPMNARAQMPAPRAPAPAMQQGGPARAGGAPGGGGPGRHGPDQHH